jgi:O-antigen ligase
MQTVAVIITMLLYAIFAFKPIVELPIFSRTLNMSPGDFMMVLIAIAITIKLLVQKKGVGTPARRPQVVNSFLYAYMALAAIFLAPTILFFILRNEMAYYIPRSLFIYFQWIIALVLFYYGSEISLKFQDIKIILCLLMSAFFAGVLGGMLIDTPSLQILDVIASTFNTQSLRLSGQIADPNQLGTIAAFFTISGIVGVVRENNFRLQLFFLLLTIGTGLIMLLTQSRESLITFFIAILCFNLFEIRERRYLPGFALMILLFLGAALAMFSVPRFAETLTAIDAGATGDALSSRDRVWKIALDIISSSPFGIGFETMALLTGSAVEQAHNAFLQATVVAGIPGLISFTCFYFLLFKLIWERKGCCQDNWLLDVYLFFVVGYLITAMGSDHFISFFNFNAIFFGLLGFAACSPDSSRKS